MALSSSDIAVSSSQYRGDPNLGGGSFGFVQLDLKPLEDLAKYTMLYNKSEYDQRQKDAEAAAKEIADYTSYDLTSSIQKDAKLLAEKYDKLINYVKANPDAINYKNKQAWAEYKKLRNDLENDLVGGKVRSTMNLVRQKEISEEKNEKRKKNLQEGLDKEISETDIRTPLKHTQQYDITVPEMPKGEAVGFDVFRTLPNQQLRRDYSLFDAKTARARASAFSLDLAADIVDESTEAGKQKLIARGENFWLKGAEFLNAAIQVNKDAAGELDESKLKGVSKDMVELIKKTNHYLEVKRNEISSGIYKDQFSTPITFGTQGIREEDYAPINYKDGLTADELAFVAQYAAWAGDTFKTATIQTNDQLERERLDVTRRGQNLDFQVQWKNAETARMNAEQKGGGGGSNIQTPAMLFGQHIDRVKQKIAQTGKEFVVPFSGTDKETRKATGVEDGQFIRWNADGGFQILQIDTKGTKVIKVGTVEELKQGYINAVKAGMNDEGIQTEGFQNEAEKAFDGIWRTRSGKNIWDNWNKPEEKTQETELSLDTNDWKKEGKNWRYKDGTLYDSKGKIIKQ